MTFTEELWSGEPVAMVYAYQEEFGAIESGSSNAQNQGRAESLWHAMKALGGPFGKFMGAYSSAMPKDVAALQAADLFAYEITKEFENRLSRPKDKMRWALKQLLNYERNPLLYFYGFETLLEGLMEIGMLPGDDKIRLASVMSQLGVKMDMEDRSTNDGQTTSRHSHEEDSQRF